MKKTLLIVLLLLSCVFIFAQVDPWLWAKKAGGISGDYGNGIAVDASGNSYVTGYFQGSATFGSTNLTSNQGSTDIFVAKLDSNGNWKWAKNAGGSGQDSGNIIAVDASGNSYVTGYFQGSATFGSTNLTSNQGSTDIFVAKLDSNGNWLWAKNAGGTGTDYGYGIWVDASGNIYVTGYFRDTATFGTLPTLTSSGDTDIFVAKLDSSGNWLWAKKAGGSQADYGYSIAVDANGNSYVTGYFQGSATFGSTNLTSSGGTDLFVTKLDSSGNWLWAKKAGGTNIDYGYGIAVDASGNSYVTGSFDTSATFGSTTLTSYGSTDIFVAKLDSSGNWLWAKKAGGSQADYGYGIAVDASGHSYVTGYFTNTATFGSTTLICNGYYDIFVAKLDSNGNWKWAKNGGGTGGDYGYGIAIDANGDSYVTGSFEGSATFGALPPLSSYGNADVFVVKVHIPSPPAAPTLNSPADNAVNISLTPTLTWSAPASGDQPTGYKLYLSTDTNPTLYNSGTITGTSYTLTTALQYNTKYYWTVSGYNAEGEGPKATVRSFTTIPAPPGAPTLNSPSDNAENISLTPTLTWSAPGSGGTPTGYKLYLSTDSNPTLYNSGTITGTSYTITTALQYNTKYYWTVSAYNEGGEGPKATVCSFNTLPLPALNWIKCLTTPNSNASIDLEWSYDEIDPPAYINIWALDYSEINGIETHPYPYYDPVNLIDEDIIINDIDPYTEGPSPLGWKKIARIPTTTHLTVDNYIYPEMVRGYYYFTLFAESNNGQMSATPKKPFYRESISYWLGDVYNNYGLIDANDMNYLSLVWGSNKKDSNLHFICDVGPTADRARRSRPMPDGKIDIEDLMIFAMNYNNTNYNYYPRNIPETQPITITMNSQYIGEQLTVSLVLDGNTGFVKGLDIPLAYGNGLQLLSVASGEVWSENGLMLYTNENGVVTISGASLGADELIEGNGTVATLIFSVVGNDTSLGLGHMTARSCENEDIEIVNNPTGDTNNEDSVNIIPVDSYLGKVYPNPFNPSTTLQYGLKEAGQVKISVFNARGQLIRTLVNESKAAGTYQIVWDGKDNNGHIASSGNYFFRMETKEDVKTVKGAMIK